MFDYAVYEGDRLENVNLLNYLKEIKYLRHLQINKQWAPHTLVIAAMQGEEVVGHLGLIKKPLQVPLNPAKSLCLDNQILYEMFVQTFHVRPEYRRQGVGTALQKKGIELSRSRGCYQLRSWSSYDKLANYTLKLKLGFVFAPEIYTVKESGLKVPGGYFIKRL